MNVLNFPFRSEIFNACLYFSSGEIILIHDVLRGYSAVTYTSEQPYPLPICFKGEGIGVVDGVRVTIVIGFIKILILETHGVVMVKESVPNGIT